MKAWFLSLRYRYEEGYNLAERIIASKATAAFVTGDELAAGLLNGLADQGVNVPEDFELITSDDSQITRYTRPNLSTVGQPLYDLGAISMRMLTKIMHKERIGRKEKFFLPIPSIIVGLRRSKKQKEAKASFFLVSV